MPRRRIPAVSTSTISPWPNVIRVSIASRVVPGVALTIVRSSPRSALRRLDLPTLGRPTSAMVTGPGTWSGSKSSPPVAASAVSCSNGAIPSASASATWAAARSWRSRRSTRARSSAVSGGRASTIASRRSATPRPCAAEMGQHSGQPSAQNSTASSSRFALSALFGASRTGADARRSISAASRSDGVMPLVASRRKTITSASAIAIRACSWTFSSIGLPGDVSRPPVSTTRNERPFQSASA